jgi:hypothetical protein
MAMIKFHVSVKRKAIHLEQDRHSQAGANFTDLKPAIGSQNPQALSATLAAS